MAVTIHDMLQPQVNTPAVRHRALLRSQGRCVACGTIVPGGASRCSDCAVKNNAACKKRRDGRKKIGQCRDCGAEAYPTVRTSRGTSYYCQKCYLKMMARGLLGSATRWAILLDKLYRSDWKCAYTGERLALGQNLSFDHMNPVIRFPEQKHDPANIEPVTLRINLAKRDMTKGEFLTLIRDIHRNMAEGSI